MDGIAIGFSILVAGSLIAGAITSFTNTVRDIYAELKANAEMHEKASRQS